MIETVSVVYALALVAWSSLAWLYGVPRIWIVDVALFELLAACVAIDRAEKERDDKKKTG
jgi:hypothetical protein